MTTLAVGKRYNFEVYAPNILGSFKNVTVLGIVDSSMANREADVYALHIQIFSYLPPGSINDPTKYDYVIVRNENGSRTILGIPFIRTNTIEEVGSKRITVTIGGSVTSADVTRVRAALVANGFTELDVQISDS